MPFFTTAANIELGISHLFTVKLKSNNDFPILDSIAKANKVKIVGNHTFRPVWYTLSCDIGSLGNALQMANTFYETKLFQYAISDILRRSAQKVGGYIYTPGQGHDPNLSWNNQMGFGRVDACMALIESFKMKSDVTGPDRICTTNTNFTLQNVPAGQTVTWAVSPTYLFPSTGRTGTGTTATLRAAGTSVSGAATLTYTVDTDCGNTRSTVSTALPSASGCLI